MKHNRIEVVMAGLFCLLAAHAGSSRAIVRVGPVKSLDLEGAWTEAREILVPGGGRIIPAAHVKGHEPQAGKPFQPVKWIPIKGGKLTMGTDNGDGNEKSLREVTIPAFEMSKTEVTVEQYAQCVIKGPCTAPKTGRRYCNWEDNGTRFGRPKPGREKHPINCVDWEQANQYAKFMSKKPGFEGARLPSESEWVYAATSKGKDQQYPWGNHKATCERAVKYGCGTGGTMPVCSKPAGNTAQGLCDMAGNVWEWVHAKAGSRRMVRGGSFSPGVAGILRVGFRLIAPSGIRRGDFGFRLAR